MCIYVYYIEPKVWYSKLPVIDFSKVIKLCTKVTYTHFKWNDRRPVDIIINSKAFSFTFFPIFFALFSSLVRLVLTHTHLIWVEWFEHFTLLEVEAKTKTIFSVSISQINRLTCSFSVRQKLSLSFSFAIRIDVNLEIQIRNKMLTRVHQTKMWRGEKKFVPSDCE